MTCFALEFLHLCSLQLILLWSLQIWFDEFMLGHLFLLRCTIVYHTIGKQKGLIILATARGVLADFWVPNEIDS